MDSLNVHIREYSIQLSKGHIQKAYGGIMSFMSDLRSYLENKYPDYVASAMYFGFMDMTYFAFTPSTMKDRNLKLAVVFLHEECRFELWLAGSNRKVQADYIKLLRNKQTGGYILSEIHPGIDSILTLRIDGQPDFDDPDGLRERIEASILRFAGDIAAMLQ